jgi:hypothetical protein
MFLPSDPCKAVSHMDLRIKNTSICEYTCVHLAQLHAQHSYIFLYTLHPRKGIAHSLTFQGRSQHQKSWVSCRLGREWVAQPAGQSMSVRTRCIHSRKGRRKKGTQWKTNQVTYGKWSGTQGWSQVMIRRGVMIQEWWSEGIMKVTYALATVMSCSTWSVEHLHKGVAGSHESL